MERERRRVERTEEWEQQELLCVHYEQIVDERIRSLVLSDELGGGRSRGADRGFREEPLAVDRGLRGGRHA
jgi:hypothetical protein